MMSFRIDPSRMRIIDKGALKAGFNVDFGNVDEAGEFTHLFTVTDFTLIAKNAGGYFMRAPGKPRTKNGEPVLNAKGYPEYDDYFRKAFVEASGRDAKAQVSKASYALFDAIGDKAGEVYDTLSGAGAKPAAKFAAPAAKKLVASPTASGFASTIDEDHGGSPLDADDDDLPF
jgi:hypothetical protein